MAIKYPGPNPKFKALNGAPHADHVNLINSYQMAKTLQGFHKPLPFPKPIRVANKKR
jgi:hypothetical protein